MDLMKGGGLLHFFEFFYELVFVVCGLILHSVSVMGWSEICECGIS